VAWQPVDRSELVPPQGGHGGDRADRGLVIVACLAAVALLGVIDYVTGPQIGVSIIYLAPIGVAAWLAGRGPGLLIAIVAAVTWGLIDRRSGMEVDHPLIPVWNALVSLVFFTLTAWLIADVRRMHARERLLARSDALTGVANARAFLEALEHELARMRRTA